MRINIWLKSYITFTIWFNDNLFDVSLSFSPSLTKLLKLSRFSFLNHPYFEKVSLSKRNGSREDILLTLITRSFPGSNVSFLAEITLCIYVTARGFHELKLANSKLEKNITMLSWNILAGTISTSFKDRWLIISNQKVRINQSYY